MPLRDLIDIEAFEETRRNAVRRLLDKRNEHGWWTGELSSSALSTATAVTALAIVDRERGESSHATLIKSGIDWLTRTQNDDGGWGDTVKSFSNISTTTLVWAAFKAAGVADDAAYSDTLRRAEARLAAWCDGDNRDQPPIPALTEAIAARYGEDRTFSVPILTMCALAGRFGDPRNRDTWRPIKPLPFELAAFPRGLFARLNLRVVSYALPALIAIGQVRHHFAPTRNPITRLLRDKTRVRTLRLLEAIQPPNGGFLEATPLTSFVTMSLAAAGHAKHAVTDRGVSFIVSSAREDGSWPIDTNLATWVTTLSVNALAAGDANQLSEYLGEDERAAIRDWLLGQQYTEVHPYTGAAPGGWAWTDLPGGVPDADDTSGAVLALWHLRESASDAPSARVVVAADAGLRWLKRVTNRDGGTPTFCRGWGKLPFDRSATDISAHAARAAQTWWLTMTAVDNDLTYAQDMDARPEKYMIQSQRADGSWLPLWFGNQQVSDESNATYGTSRMLVALCTTSFGRDVSPAIRRALQWFLAQQNSDGGWGGGAGAPSSIEETALAVEALACAKPQAVGGAGGEAIARGVRWLIEHTHRGTRFDPSPIGFYFAKLWYFEKLYPVIFSVAALERVAKMLADDNAA